MGNGIINDTVGVVCARGASKRLKDKNIRLIGSETLAARACRTLHQAGIEDVYCITDIEEDLIRLPKYVKRVERDDGEDDNKWLQDTIKDHFCEIDKVEYGYIAVLMPNGPFITSPIVRDVADLLSDGRKIVRTYGYDGKENGLIYSDIKYFLDGETDVYTGSIHTFGFEIHDIADYAKAVKLLVS